MKTAVRNKARLRGVGPVVNAREIHGSWHRNGENKTSDVLYFLCVEYPHIDPFIKIGSSSKFSRRFDQHKSNYGNAGGKVCCVALCSGTPQDEQMLKHYFSKHIRNGKTTEEFNVNKEMCDWLRWLRNQFYVEVEEEWRGGIPPEYVTIIDFEFWKPGVEGRALENQTPLFPEPSFHKRNVTGDDFYTPEGVVCVIKDAFECGYIDLDPASHPAANKIVKAHRFYQKGEDGTKQPWDAASVYVNPPFSQWPSFAETAVRELDRGVIKEMLALVSTPTLTAKYFGSLLKRSCAIIVLPGRLDFEGPYSTKGSSPTSGHVLLYFGERTIRVAEIFKQKLGAIVMVNT